MITDPLCSELIKLPPGVHITIIALAHLLTLTIGYLTGRFVLNRTLVTIIMALIGVIFKRPKKVDQQQNKES